MAGLFLKEFDDSEDGRFRIGAAEDGNGAAASSSGNSCPVQAAVHAGLSHEFYQKIGPRRSKPATRITGMRLIHQLAKSHQPVHGERLRHQLREQTYPFVFVN